MDEDMEFEYESSDEVLITEMWTPEYTAKNLE